jgi:pentapeptide MXKDX repeat protein
MKPLFAAMIVMGLALAPAAFAEDAMKPMSKDTKMDKMDKKTDAMSHSSDKMKKTDGMMDKKDTMAKDGMKKDEMTK